MKLRQYHRELSSALLAVGLAPAMETDQQRIIKIEEAIAYLEAAVAAIRYDEQLQNEEGKIEIHNPSSQVDSA
jgi:anti-sigma regulatory factor (Ser/Thr protein kinase)